MVFRHVKTTWSRVLAFKEKNKYKYITTIAVNKNGNLQVTNKGTLKNYDHKIEMQKWHKIIIEQVSVYKKVNLFSMFYLMYKLC